MARKMTSKEYPTQFNDVAQASFAEWPAGALIATWPVPDGENAARVLIHRFNRYRNCLWDEESPYAVSAKDLTVTKVEIAGVWHVTFKVLNIYSRREKDDGLTGAMSKLDATLERLEVATPTSVSNIPGIITPEQAAVLEAQRPKNFFEEFEERVEAKKAAEAAAQPKVKCKHELNDLTDACILCGVHKDAW